MQNLSNTPPASSELEISIFGPGFGECILVHAGDGDWIIVDSCVDTHTGLPKALAYLQSLNVDAGSAVRVLIASHWHDDHVRGMHALLDACKSATFSCARALTQREFLSVAQLYEQPSHKASRSTKELYNCLKEIAARSQAGVSILPLKFAVPDRTLWKNASGSKRLTTLSPSDEMDRRALEHMAATLAALKKGAPADRLIAHAPNEVAVVIRVDVEGRSILLGSDLEEEGNVLVGWSAVLAGVSAKERRSGVFKVAHHGSETGHHEGIWGDMLDPKPLSLLSPFRHGRHALPTQADRRRILERSSNAYITADPDLTRKPKAKIANKTQLLVSQTAKNRRLAIADVGHVRWRAPIGDPNAPGVVELFDGAMDLAALVS